MEATAPSRRKILPQSPRLLARFGDERLVEHARRGNEAAYVAIYDRYSSGLLSFCRHMLGSRDEAEDALQQTFASAYSALRVDDRPIVLKPWLYTIARNRCLSMLRARREQPSDEIDPVSLVGLSDGVERRADLRELVADLESLPERQREALVLSEVGDLSHVDVAEVLGCETRQVKALVFQARSSLIESRRAREVPCAEIREQLATARGGALRRGPLRRHLQTCEGCREFRDEVRKQRAMLAIALPVIPSLGLKEAALAAAGLGGGGATGGGGMFAALGAHGAAKATAVVIAAGGTVGGIAATEPDLFSGWARGADGVEQREREGDGGKTDGDSRAGRGEFDWKGATDAARAETRRARRSNGFTLAAADDPVDAAQKSGIETAAVPVVPDYEGALNSGDGPEPFKRRGRSDERPRGGEKSRGNGGRGRGEGSGRDRGRGRGLERAGEVTRKAPRPQPKKEVDRVDGDRGGPHAGGHKPKDPPPIDGLPEVRPEKPRPPDVE